MCRVGTYMITQLDIQIRKLPADVRSAVLGSAIPDATSQRPESATLLPHPTSFASRIPLAWANSRVGLGGVRLGMQGTGFISICFVNVPHRHERRITRSSGVSIFDDPFGLPHYFTAQAAHTTM